MAVKMSNNGICIEVAENHPFLQDIDLKSAVVHELFHILQINQGFPLVYVLKDPKQIGPVIQNIVTDLFVTNMMCSQGYTSEAESITLHRLESLIDFPKIISSYGYLSVIARIPVVKQEVTRFFKQYLEKMTAIEQRMKPHFPAEMWQLYVYINQILSETDLNSDDADIVLNLYKDIFLAIDKKIKFSILNSCFIITDAGELFS